jgi:hypothetical protein
VADADVCEVQQREKGFAAEGPHRGFVPV